MDPRFPETSIGFLTLCFVIGLLSLLTFGVLKENPRVLQFCHRILLVFMILSAILFCTLPVYLASMMASNVEATVKETSDQLFRNGMMVGFTAQLGTAVFAGVFSLAYGTVGRLRECILIKRKFPDNSV